jgi:hypothetical protein
MPTPVRLLWPGDQPCARMPGGLKPLASQGAARLRGRTRRAAPRSGAPASRLATLLVCLTAGGRRTVRAAVGSFETFPGAADGRGGPPPRPRPRRPPSPRGSCHRAWPASWDARRLASRTSPWPGGCGGGQSLRRSACSPGDALPPPQCAHGCEPTMPLPHVPEVRTSVK